VKSQNNKYLQYQYSFKTTYYAKEYLHRFFNEPLCRNVRMLHQLT